MASTQLVWHPFAAMTPDEQKREIARLDYEMLMADGADRVKHQVELGKAILQALTVVNGGAIVALFTLIGKQGSDLALDATMLKRAFGFFIAGLVLSLVCGLAGFMSQYWYAFSSLAQAWDMQETMLGGEPAGRDYKTPHKWGTRAILVTIACSVLSLLCFAVGSWSALSGVLDKSTTVVAPF